MAETQTYELYQGKYAEPREAGQKGALHRLKVGDTTQMDPHRFERANLSDRLRPVAGGSVAVPELPEGFGKVSILDENDNPRPVDGDDVDALSPEDFLAQSAAGVISTVQDESAGWTSDEIRSLIETEERARPKPRSTVVNALKTRLGVLIDQESAKEKDFR